MGVGGDKIYALFKNSCTAVIFPFSAAPLALALELTEKDTFSHSLPPLPTEFDKSMTTLSQGPTNLGIDIATVGRIGAAGVDTFIVDSDTNDHEVHVSATVVH